MEKSNQEKLSVRREIKEKTIGYVLAAFGFVAGLAWNEAVKSLIDKLFPDSGNSVIMKFVYALIITAIVVIITVYLVKLTEKSDNKNKNN